jgi:Carboxylesterase family
MNIANRGLSQIFLLTLLHLTYNGFSQYKSVSIHADVSKQTFTYAVKDTARLGLDVYSKSHGNPDSLRPCIIFIFGGAFIGGRRDDTLYNTYFNTLAENNYIVVSISYRLGLRGKKVSKLNIGPLRDAIAMAVEDTYDATNWVLGNAEKYGIDTSKIILSGSSSGAITSLMADYGKRNLTSSAAKLPAGFQYAGVMAFAGAILSFDWGLKYKIKPPPTLMFYGTEDHLVPYNKIRFLNKGLYGSSWIAKTLKENDWPYEIYRAVGLGHEEAVLPMIYQLPRILDFMDRFIIQEKPYQIDFSFKDPSQKATMVVTPDEVFKKSQ